MTCIKAGFCSGLTSERVGMQTGLANGLPLAHDFHTRLAASAHPDSSTTPQASCGTSHGRHTVTNTEADC